MFEIQLRWSQVHQSRHICSYSSVLKSTLLLSVTFYALQAFEILPPWAEMRKEELPRRSLFHAKNLNCSMERALPCFSVLLATLPELMCIPQPSAEVQHGPRVYPLPCAGTREGGFSSWLWLGVVFQLLYFLRHKAPEVITKHRACELRCCFLCAFKLLW